MPSDLLVIDAITVCEDVLKRRAGIAATERMERSRLKGFTLIELLVALSVMAILLGVGVPSFVDALKDGRISSGYNALIGSLFLARSEAVKSAGNITVCPRTTPTSEQCGTDWQNGWLVFRDSVIVSGETTAEISAGDEVIGVTEELHQVLSLKAFGSSNRTAAGATARNYVRYTANGSSDWNNGYFVLCDDRGAEEARAVNLVLTGDIRQGRPSTSSTVPLDVFGRAISCPTS